MTDLTHDAMAAKIGHHTSEDAQRRLRRRYAAERRFKYYGIGAICLGLGMLAILLISIGGRAIPALTQNYLTLQIEIPPEPLVASADHNYMQFVEREILSLFPEAVGDFQAQRQIMSIMPFDAAGVISERVLEDVSVLGGERIDVTLQLTDEAQAYVNGEISRSTPEADRRLTDDQMSAIDRLRDDDVIVVQDGRPVLDIAVNLAFYEVVNQSNFQSLANDALYRLFPEVEGRARRDLRAIISPGAGFELRQMILADPGLIGSSVSLEVPLSDEFDQLAKNFVDRELPEDQRRVNDAQIAYFDGLEEAGLITSRFNTQFFTAADSRQPELAGIWGALVGSFYTLVVTLLLSFPIGVSAAIYLEEFAPKNRLTDLIEVNINNLAAVPSIVFGLLGLAVFIQFFGLPRSAPLVGGMVLALMTLPTIIIASRAALKAVPPSIREAALGMGASRLQTVTHHVLPLAMPGILTGTIIGMAQALGETAPLLMVGMVAFITSTPEGLTSPATVLPVQIYIWSDAPERGFVAKTSLAIMTLLVFLICMNALAVWLRKRFERRW